MNYRHAYHAGNFADVFKHWLLWLVLDHFLKKDKPFFTLDTHAGVGLYDLARDESRRTGEADTGIRRLLEVGVTAPSVFSGYIDFVRAMNEGEDAGPSPRWYPGSPWIIANRLRRGGEASLRDRFFAIEAHPEDHRLLSETMAEFRHTRTRCADGYAAIPSMLPPKEKRALTLIDPPFESRTEIHAITRAADLAIRQFGAGTVMIWYPIKDRAAVEAFKPRLPDPPKGRLSVELAIAGTDPDGPLTATGVIILNPPYDLAETIAPALPFLRDLLAQGPGAYAEAETF